jgi:serine/threonine protein phosphatase 1
MAVPLKALVETVSKRDPAANWIFVGDYVNRGPDSRGVIDFLLKLPNARFGRGNHDDIFDVLLNGQSYVEQLTNNNRAGAYKWFMEHGIHDSNMNSVLANLTPRGVEQLVAGIPQSHRQFVRDLQPVIEEPDIFIVHARWDPATPDEDPSPTTYLDVDRDLRKTATWGRFTAEEIDMEKTWRRTGFFGHSPVDFYGARGGFNPKGGGKLVPIIGQKMVLIDTAAAISPVGRLTAYCPDTSSFIQVDRQGKLVDNESPK